MGLFFATFLQTLMIFSFVYILTPFSRPVKKLLPVLGGVVIVLCLAAASLAARYGLGFISSWGFLIISVPAFLSAYILSVARGIRYVFIVLTAFLFHQMLSSLLMSFRIAQGGYTPAYYFLSVLMFGALLAGGRLLRRDFHKILLTYRAEFCSLCPILLLLYVLIRTFSPVVEPDVLDPDLLLLAIVLDLLIVLIYLYICINFHSLSKYCENMRETMSLKLQVEEAQTHISILRTSQEKAAHYRHDLRHHLSLIRTFLSQGEQDQLQNYLDEVQAGLDNDTPKRYCQNEAVNLLLLSFEAKANAAGVRLHTDLQVPHLLRVSNPELCALLSNALENAITAARQVQTAEQKQVRLLVRFSESKLLISAENPYTGTVRMENGLPQSPRAGHGLGVKSMAAIVEKHGGLYSFKAEDGHFTLRIAI